jgi:hypothetical protein
MEFLVGDRPAEPEETSSIVITDLLNFAMPFIRYQTDDIGRFHARSHCPCGLDTVRMEVEGRTFEMLRDVDSRELTSQQVMDLVWGWGDVYLWQLRLTEPGRGTFAYFPDRQPEAEVDAVLDGLHGLLGPDWRIERLPSSHLKPEERGKYCFVKALYPRELPQLFPDRLV